MLNDQNILKRSEIDQGLKMAHIMQTYLKHVEWTVYIYHYSVNCLIQLVIIGLKIFKSSASAGYFFEERFRKSSWILPFVLIWLSPWQSH